MIAAVSESLASSSATRTQGRRPGTAASRTGWAFQPMPNLSRETRQAIGKAKAGWTFATICTELGYACHKGRATWDQQRLGIGLRALARESGQDVRKVRRDVKALAGLGLVVTSRPNILHVADPATGRIVTKAKGRCEATYVYLTITEAALRPSKGRFGATGGTTMEPSPAACKGHGGTTVREEQNQRQPDGDADGIGSPPAPGGRLPPADVPATAPVLPVDAGRDEPPLPSGRILPTPGATKASKASRAPGRRGSAASGDVQTQTAEEYARQWQRVDPDTVRRREEWKESKRRKAEAAKADPPATTDRPVTEAARQDAGIEAARAAWMVALDRLAS